jgi:LacI family transcriptional regulator
MNITIKDIAKMLNVSHTTVSRSLNDSPLISKATKDKVKALAKKYNYKPNVSARSLVLARSYNIGLFFSTLKTGTTANFFLDTVRGVNEVLKGAFNLSVEAVDDLSNFDGINNQRFEGIIMMSQNPKDDEFIAHVLKEGIPLVVLNREVRQQKVSTVLSDDFIGAYNLSNYVLDQGHVKIAIIEGMPEFKTTQRRKQGFLKALEERSVQHNPDLAIEGKYTIESGYKAMKTLLKLSELPTLVFCSNDDMAIGAMKAIREANLSIPDQISIVGYDDCGISGYLSPALTTIKRPIEKISSEGTKTLLKKLNEPSSEEGMIIYLETSLMVRDSVKNIN